VVKGLTMLELMYHGIMQVDRNRLVYGLLGNGVVGVGVTLGNMPLL